MSYTTDRVKAGVIRHKYFLRWWLVFLLISIFSGFSFHQGMFDIIWKNDVTKLSFAIIALFYIQSILCGLHTWRSGADKGVVEAEDVESGWFMSDLFLSIGMVGTVIGFISMLAGFSSLDVSDTQTVQALIKDLGLGMSTALYTTLVGLVCSILLKVQYFNLSQGTDLGEK